MICASERGQLRSQTGAQLCHHKTVSVNFSELVSTPKPSEVGIGRVGVLVNEVVDEEVRLPK